MYQHDLSLPAHGMTLASIIEAYRAGQNAYHDGQELMACPHLILDLAVAWEGGWSDASFCCDWTTGSHWPGDPEEQGRAAYGLGYAADTNPHPTLAREDRAAWARGWEHARQAEFG